jgi:dihydrofolate synthase / folylpolyglutamate synthase
VNVVPRKLSGEVPRPLTYKQALAWLYGLQQFGIKLGLENTERLLRELHISLGSARASRAVSGASPETSASPKVIHVAGTNGKGSVCAMIDSILRAQGYRTGLFTSPHLITFRERIRLNGEMVTEEAVASGLTAIRDLVTDWDPHPTFFEVTTALALRCFSEAKIDTVILETGMGGRLDATNAIQSNVSIITPIDFDHEKWLGQSLGEIAAEKAGIIKRKTPVVSAAQRPEAEEAIRARAAECETPIKYVTASYETTLIALGGSHQKKNAALAITGIRAAKIDIGESAIVRGLTNVEWPARFQRWDERTIIDGAHNPAAAGITAESWREIFGDQRATLILAVLSDKDLRGICAALAPISDYVLFPQIRSARAAAPEEVAKVLAEAAPSLPYFITPSIADALNQARERPHPVLITGSLHFAGEVLAYLRGEPAAFEECAQ